MIASHPVRAKSRTGLPPRDALASHGQSEKLILISGRQAAALCEDLPTNSATDPKLESTLFEELQTLSQYYAENNNRNSATFCTALLVDPSFRSRILAYCRNDLVTLAVSDKDINRYADKYRPSIRNLPPEQVKVACVLIRLLRVAEVETIPFEAGQKLAELLIFNTVFDEIKGAIALQDAVKSLLRGE